jgi:plasmid maintenance system antidote protein VapI
MLKIDKDKFLEIAFARGYANANAVRLALRIPQATMSNYVNGKRFLPNDMAERLSNFLNCPVEDFTFNETKWEFDLSSRLDVKHKLTNAINDLTDKQLELYLAMINETIRLNKIADKMDHLDVE